MEFRPYNAHSQRLCDDPAAAKIVERIYELLGIHDEKPDIVYGKLEDCVGCYYQGTPYLSAEIVLDAKKLKRARWNYWFQWHQNTFWGVVVHEIRHHYQYQNGMIQDVSDSLLWPTYTKRWLGKDVTTNRLATKENILKYYQLPWEYDANTQAHKITQTLIDEGLIEADPEYYETKYGPEEYFKRRWNAKLYTRFLYNYWKHKINNGIEKISWKAQETRRVSVSQL